MNKTHEKMLDRARRLLPVEAQSYAIEEYRKGLKPVTIISIEIARKWKKSCLNDYVAALAVNAGITPRTRKEVSRIYNEWRNRAYNELYNR